jgi:hypothetical protein
MQISARVGIAMDTGIMSAMMCIGYKPCRGLHTRDCQRLKLVADPGGGALDGLCTFVHCLYSVLLSCC